MQTVLMKFLKEMWAFLIKDFLSGILAKTLKDIALKFIQKTPWTVIFERLLTRLLVVCLKWLASLSTNKLWVDTVNDFLAVLKGSGLREANPIEVTSRNTGQSVGSELEPGKVEPGKAETATT